MSQNYTIFINAETESSPVKLTIVSRLNERMKDPVGFNNYALLPADHDEAYELGQLVIADHFTRFDTEASASKEPLSRFENSLEAFAAGVAVKAELYVIPAIEIVELSAGQMCRWA